MTWREDLIGRSQVVAIYQLPWIVRHPLLTFFSYSFLSGQMSYQQSVQKGHSISSHLAIQWYKHVYRTPQRKREREERKRKKMKTKESSSNHKHIQHLKIHNSLSGLEKFIPATTVWIIRLKKDMYIWPTHCVHTPQLYMWFFKYRFTPAHLQHWVLSCISDPCCK